jgi:amidase
MILPELCDCDATAQADLVRRGELSPQDLAEHAIACITTLNPQTNAVVTPLFDAARAAARQHLPAGPLRGVPILVKDSTSVAGARWTSGSALYAQRVAARDSALVQRYRQTGLLIMGKTNLSEFGIQPTSEPRLFGACRNPWQPDHSPGGSSGGSAAAVAARMVAAAHGSDGGGSLRIPASCCGVFGLKPSRGRVPAEPGGGPLQSLVAEHVLTRSVRDSATLLDIAAGQDDTPYSRLPLPPLSLTAALQHPPGRLRIAWSARSPFGGAVHPECVAATRDAAALCAAMGHAVEECDIVVDAEQVQEWFTTIWAVGCTLALALSAAQGNEPHAEQVEPLTWALFERARRTPAPLYECAWLQLRQVARQVLRVFETLDVWLSPTLAQPALPLGILAPSADDPLAAFGKGFDITPFTPLFNLTGQPAASLPLYWNADGLPVGVQIVGRAGAETTLLQLSRQLEQARSWLHHRPPSMR